MHTSNRFIKNYAKSLELNPKNINAIEKLNELVKKIAGSPDWPRLCPDDCSPYHTFSRLADGFFRLKLE